MTDQLIFTLILSAGMVGFAAVTYTRSVRQRKALMAHLLKHGFERVNLERSERDKTIRRDDRRFNGMEHTAFVRKAADHDLWLLTIYDSDGPGKPFLMIDMKSRAHPLSGCILFKDKDGSAAPSIKVNLRAKLSGFFYPRQAVLRGWHVFTRKPDSALPSSTLAHALLSTPECTIRSTDRHDLIIECRPGAGASPLDLPPSHHALLSKEMLQALAALVKALQS